MQNMNVATMSIIAMGLFDIPDRPMRRRRWKQPGTSATGSITVEERQFRNQKRKAAKKAKRRNR